MQLGMIGLGRMGASMVARLLAGGHDCVVYNKSPGPVAELARAGATGSTSLADFAARLAAPRAVWLMVPAGAVDGVLEALLPLLGPGDTVIDGGNSRYHDDLLRAERLARLGMHWVDAGTSGGVWGRERGYCLMVGGERPVVQRLAPVFETLAPGAGDIARTPGRERATGAAATAERGWLHCGPAGAGHFVKMVHNGIEYGLMAAYAEGLNILRHANIGGAAAGAHDAETTPLSHPEHYRYDIDVAAVTELWRRGSVVSSWLLDLTAAALAKSPELADFSGRVSDSGEGRWTIAAAIDEGVPAPVLTAALYDRFASRGEAEYAHKLLSAMRHAFGGHLEKKAT
ncbi:MAG TPA: decarboxylating 6-phosphogluconate dehydrogenase [Planctomycetota bacterium]|nr:decarboxylating 6-phosphogluconate dehydrogenase [Planctomycetota bacterium]